MTAKKNDKKNVAPKKAETKTATVVPEVDLSQLTVAQLKEALKAKKAESRDVNYEDSRTTKIAKAIVTLEEHEEYVMKAQEVLDVKIKARDVAQERLDEKREKWGKLPEDVIQQKVVEERKRRQQVRQDAIAKSKNMSK